MRYTGGPSFSSFSGVVCNRRVRGRVVFKSVNRFAGRRCFGRRPCKGLFFSKGSRKVRFCTLVRMSTCGRAVFGIYLSAPRTGRRCLRRVRGGILCGESVGVARSSRLILLAAYASSVAGKEGVLVKHLASRVCPRGRGTGGMNAKVSRLGGTMKGIPIVM